MSMLAPAPHSLNSTNNTLVTILAELHRTHKFWIKWVNLECQDRK